MQLLSNHTAELLYCFDSFSLRACCNSASISFQLGALHFFIAFIISLTSPSRMFVSSSPVTWTVETSWCWYNHLQYVFQQSRIPLESHTTVPSSFLDLTSSGVPRYLKLVTCSTLTPSTLRVTRTSLFETKPLFSYLQHSEIVRMLQ